MSKKLTTEQARLLDYDTRALQVQGTLDRMWVFPELVSQADSETNFAKEDTGNWNARAIEPSISKHLRFVALPPASKRVKPVFKDAIGIAHSTADGTSAVSGFSILLSDCATRKIESHVADECSFVPVEVIGASQPYHAMWVRRIVDALSETESTLTRVGFSGQLNPARCAFGDGVKQPKHLFRLPQWKYFADYDFCTGRFVELVHRLNISGFHFFIGGALGPELERGKGPRFGGSILYCHRPPYWSHP